MIAPPYSREFVDIFLPIVKNESITGILRNADKKDDVSKFLCKLFYLFHPTKPYVCYTIDSEDRTIDFAPVMFWTSLMGFFSSKFA